MDWDESRNRMRAKLSRFRAASETLLVVEQPTDSNTQGSWIGATCAGIPVQHDAADRVPGSLVLMRTDAERMKATSHGVRWNYLFANGHVALLRSTETVRGIDFGNVTAPNYMWTRRTDD